MSRPRKGPRAGSRSSLALAALHALGGTARVDDWRVAANFKDGVAQFYQAVVRTLQRFQLISRAGAIAGITKQGRAFLGAIDASATPDSTPAPSRYVPPMRDLSSKYMPRIAVMRPGALDYREIPSRFGDQRIPHGEKAAA